MKRNKQPHIYSLRSAIQYRTLSHKLTASFCSAYEQSVCLARLSAWPCWLVSVFDRAELLFLSVLHRLCCLTYWLPPCLTNSKCSGICQWIHNVVGQAFLSMCVEFYGAEPVVWNWSKLLSGLTMIHSQREGGGSRRSSAELNEPFSGKLFKRAPHHPA